MHDTMTTTTAAKAVSDEQVKLINDIWFHAERLFKGFGPESLRLMISDPHGNTLDEFFLRHLAMGLKDKFRNG